MAQGGAESRQIFEHCRAVKLEWLAILANRVLSKWNDAFELSLTNLFVIIGVFCENFASSGPSCQSEATLV